MLNTFETVQALMANLPIFTKHIRSVIVEALLANPENEKTGDKMKLVRENF